MSESIDQVRKQIISIARLRHPRMRNFTLSEGAIKKFLKDYNGNLEEIVNELYRIIGNKPNGKFRLMVMSEGKNESKNESKNK